MGPAKVFSIGTTLVDVQLNWFNWVHFLIFEGALDLSSFLDVIRISISTVFFHAQLDPEILSYLNDLSKWL